MRSALASVPGVNDVIVDREAKTATVTLDADGVPSTTALLAALEGTKFKAKVRQ